MIQRMLRLEVTTPARVTYFTVSTHRFFPGTVALLNSLHVSGNIGNLVVLDAGLTSRERDLLSQHATVFAPPRAIDEHPVLLKASAHLLQPSGEVVVIDSDMIVTGSLEPALACARDGKICAFPDVPAVRGRWFAEWEHTLALRRQLRRDVYVNSGFVAFSTIHWPELLTRWRELCQLIPPSDMWGRRSPFNAPDQDALNALLMSEIPREAVALLPEDEQVFGGDVSVDDFETLACTSAGRLSKILHLIDSPKPWEPSGWLRLAGIDYAQLMRRLLFADDVPLRLDRDQVPLWLRPGMTGKRTLRMLGSANRAIVSAAHSVPEPLRMHLRELRRRTALKNDPHRSAQQAIAPSPGVPAISLVAVTDGPSAAS